tara:strand:- start:4901 stop:5923 length:1023 start_codon:yes stop_codon:yes gene_type:complete
MFNFDSFLNLPLIWGGLIATAILLYVLLDGFDLGLGILFLFAPDEQSRDRMMNSIAPFWDGNETWLVLGGGGLFAAFPLAYAVLLPALYIPIILMLLGLIFRGVAFEFRFKATGRDRQLWDLAFHSGSLLATFMQGMVLGGFVQGVMVAGRSFAGGPFDWLTAFSVMTGLALVFGYTLLGATWLVMKTDGPLQHWARRVARYVLGFVGLGLALVSLTMPFLNEGVKEFWFSLPNFWALLPLPLITAGLFALLWRSLGRGREVQPFLLALTIFLMGFLGLGLSLWPWVVPYHFTLEEAAAAPESLSLLLVGAVIFLPMVLAYTAWSYYVFRGKTAENETTY